MVELREKGNVEVTVLPLTPLRQVRVVRGTLEEVLQEACEDYVRVELTDTEDLDVIAMQEQVNAAFPNLLEIRRELRYKVNYGNVGAAKAREMDPFELCCAFLSGEDGEGPSDREKEVLQDVINTVRAGR